MNSNKYYTFNGAQYTCAKCGRTFNEEGRLLRHYFCSHFKDLSLREKAEYYSFKKSSRFHEYNVSVEAIESFIRPTGGLLPENDKNGSKFSSFYSMVTSVREYDCEKDTERFFNIVLPFKLTHPKASNNSELCSIIFKKKENADKLSAIMKSKNPLTGHDDRYSPFSKNFKGYDGLSDIEKTQKIHEAIKVDQLDKFKNQKGYWIKQGYSEEEAEKMVSEYQSQLRLGK